MRLFEGRTANETWKVAAEAFREGRGVDRAIGRGGATLEILHALTVVSDPAERWILAREPAINPAFALAEVVWIVNGRDDAEFLNFWNPALPKYAGKGPAYYGAYGHRLRQQYGFDQVEAAYRALEANPQSRQVVLQIWDPRSDLPGNDGAPRAADVPCNLCSILKVREGKLHWTQVMRSNDFILGLPHNVVQFTYLQELFAAWLGLDLGPYSHLSDSLHVYEEQLGTLRDSDPIEPATNLERWKLGYEQTMEVFRSMATRMDGMRLVGNSAELLSLAADDELPTAAANMLRVVGADAARRHGWPEAMGALVERCTNQVFLQAWERWLRRQTSE